jgi:rRNA-processing protein FCF1
MRHGRAKAARKTLQYFKRTVGLQTKPFLPVLLDGSFIVTLFQQKILPVNARIERVLQIKSSSSSSTTTTTTTTTSSSDPSLEKIKYFITQPALAELQMILETLESKKHAKTTSFRDAMEWIRKECTVLKQQQQDDTIRLFNSPKKRGSDKAKEQMSEKQQTPSSNAAMDPKSAILYHVGTEHDERVYVVGTQDEKLLEELRSMGTVPIMRLANNSVLLLEQPSKSSQRQAHGSELQKWKHSVPEAELALVRILKTSQSKTSKTPLSTNKNDKLDPTLVVPAPHQRAKRKAKGPNPLSCKPSKKAKQDKDSQISASKKRRERRTKNSGTTTNSQESC